MRATLQSACCQIHKVHKYLVGSCIAKGSFSSIYTALRSSDHSPCAIKMISKRRMNRYRIYSDILFGEGTIAPLLNHPNIARIYETIETAGQLFLVMDFFENDLLSYICYDPSVQNPYRPKHTKNNLLTIFDQILSAVEYLHSLNLCHRDIKPDNILLTKSNTVKLCDFDFMTFSLNKCSHACGSYGYTAPEVIKNIPYDGQKADIWSLGVLLYTIFAQKCPFSTERGTEPHLLNVNNIDFSKVPMDVGLLIREMLNEDPSQRPTVSEIRCNSLFEQIPFREDSVNHCIEPILSADHILLTRTSEMIKKPFEWVSEQLREENVNQCQIIYHLIQAQLTSISENSEYSIHNFSHSPPISDVSHQRFGIIKEEIIHGNSFIVDGAINNLLLPRRFCVSTSVDGLKSIVLNTPGDDICVDLTITDCPDKQMCKVTMQGGPSANQTMKDVADYLRTTFNTDCQSVA
ncbi:CAMK family protein kinase [Tritrichomonas foetus]|uniref:CAMK family protein kinase n=1 Tax=Tritrichomonas foetus TaxID=1144522 RepID=A0A1J4KV32_9EUKA|nr:CAMK family protein kinase [Tritrichomonas foetus]|eukprot:OHT14752.1 CAMK family protein kinase [Tritrichomonas foetus]